LLWAGLALAVRPGQCRAADALASADSAWARGDHAAAADGYRLVLAADPGSVRAVFRLGLIESWSDRLDTALVLVRRARVLEPGDLEIRIAEARILSWMSRFAASLAAYDSLLLVAPNSRDAGLGRARTLAWAGRLAEADSAYVRVAHRHEGDVDAALGRAEVALWREDPRAASFLYRELLAREPGNADARTGLARIDLRQGRNIQAREGLARVLAADPTHRAARALAAEVDAALRPRLESRVSGSEDSDRNVAWEQSVSATRWLANGLAGFASAGVLEASDPARHSRRENGEIGLAWAHGNHQVTTAVGVRELRPGGLAARSIASGRAVVSRRIARRLTVGLDGSSTPLDETAVLIGRGLSAQAIGGSLDATLPGRLGLSAGFAGAALSDGNHRRVGVVGLDAALPWRLRTALVGRRLAFERHGQGYFSPDRFSVLEARLSREWDGPRWTGGLHGGAGGQQSARTARAQAEWHVEGRLGRRWSRLDRVELFFGLSEGGWRSDSGAYRFRSLGASVSLGL
jgi:tetratricopeptide (TPR) repeat protein